MNILSVNGDFIGQLQELIMFYFPKGPITWWVSSRAEISVRLTGLKFQIGFWNKSSENQVVDYMERDSARGAIQPGLKILARNSTFAKKV